MKKTILLLFLLAVSLLSSQLQVDDFPAKEMKKQNIKIAKLTAQALSKNLPQVIDKYTSLIKVKSENSTIVWTFEINTGAKSDKSIQSQDHARMKKAVTQGICKSSIKFLVAGINTSYIYISAKSKAQLFRFDISQKDCIGI